MWPQAPATLQPGGGTAVPFEAIRLSRALDGSAGRNRAPHEACVIGTANDYYAIQTWLSLWPTDSQTFRAYRKEAERFLEKARAASLEDAALLLELARVKTGKAPPDWAAAERLLESAQRLEGYDDAAIGGLLARALHEQGKLKELRRLLITTKEPGDEHQHSGQDCQGEQCPPTVVSSGDRRNVGHDDGHGPGALDDHEDRTGGESAGDGPHHVAVEPEDGVDPGEETVGQTVGHALDTEDEAGDGVVLQRLATEQRTRPGPDSIHARGRLSLHQTRVRAASRPGSWPSAPRIRLR